MKTKRSHKRRSGAERYEVAKALLRQATKDGLVLLRWYNSYTSSKSLKVYWCYREPDESGKLVSQEKAIQSLRVRLWKLVDYSGHDERGGDIFGFSK